MATDIRNVSLVGFLPSSIASDPEIVAMCRALDPEIRDIAAEAIAPAIFPRLADVPERVLDEVAWGFRLNELQIWDSATVSGKRALLANIFAILKRSGTKFAVRRIFDLMSVVGEVVEWFEEGAAPYTYRLRIFVDEVGITLLQLLQITELHHRFESTRSQLSEFAVESNRTAPMLIYPVPATGRHVTIPFGGP